MGRSRTLNQAPILAIPSDDVHIGVFTEIESLPIPVIALVDGYALGGGNELAMSAHYRIATENASFGQPEVKLGIIPGYGGMQRLPRLIGPAGAVHLCCNGEPVDGKTAVAMGLADAFSPSSRALVDAVQAARGFASGTAALQRRNWDELAARQVNELSSVINADGIRDVLSAQTPDAAGAKDLRAARRAAACVAVSAMVYGYRNGFSAGLENDAHFFGEITASPGGQEWIGRFLAKDPLQSSSMIILPSLEGT